MVLGLLLVLIVGILELCTDIQRVGKLIIGSLWLVCSDESKDGWSIDGSSASINDGVADLSDQNNQSSRGVVVLRVRPDQQDSMHDWDKKVNHLIELLSSVSKLIEEIQQGLEIEEVLSGLGS